VTASGMGAAERWVGGAGGNTRDWWVAWEPSCPAPAPCKSNEADQQIRCIITGEFRFAEGLLSYTYNSVT